MRYLFPVLFLAGCVGGCSTLDGYPERIDLKDQYITEVGAFASPNAVLAYAAETNLERQTALRNNIITARLYAIDVNFHRFARDLTTQQNFTSVAADWIALGLAGAGATTGTAATKATLAAIASGVLGAKATIDKDVFYTKTVPTLLTQMEAQRKNVLATIYIGLQKSSSSYTIYQALADIDDYYNAGTLNGALVALTTTVGSNSLAASYQIAAVLSDTYSFDDPAQKLRRFWKPDGKINSENAAKIRNWMKNARISVGDISSFIYMSGFNSQRAQAVKDLNIQ